MQKIILLVEPNDDAFITPAKIGNIFMNRFAIHEDASSEAGLAGRTSSAFVRRPPPSAF